MKVSFDLNSMKEWGTEHVEKIVFGLVVVLLLLFAVRAVGTVSSGRPSFTPDKLIEEAASAKSSWEGTDPDKYVDELGLVRVDYEEISKGQTDVPTEPYDLTRVWDYPVFGTRGKRGLPDVLPVKDLVATAGQGAVSMGSGLSGRMAGRGGVQGQRWVVVTGLLPIKAQMDAYELAFEDALFRDPQRDVPIYVGYHVERREVDPGGVAGQEEWRKINLMMAFQAAGYRGGRGAQEVVHQRYLPLQMRGTAPMAFPLLALAKKRWGAEAAHPPEIPLLIDMAEMERRAMGPSGAEEEAGEGEGEGEGEEPEGVDEFGGFGGFVGTGRPGMGGEEGFDMEGSAMGMGMGMGMGMEGMASEMGGMGSYAGAVGSSPYAGGSGSPYGSGSSLYGGAASPYGVGMGGSRGMTRVEKPLEYQLFRFVDVTVDPGKHYQYRIKIGLANPNYKVATRHLEDVSLTKSPSIAAEWSDPTDAVVVPRDSRLLAGPVKPPNGVLPTSIMYEPTCRVMAVTIQMEDGLEAAHEITAHRGQLGDFVAVLAQETGPGTMYGPGSIMGELGDEEGSMMGMMGSEMEMMMGPEMAAGQPRPAARRDDDDEEAEEINHSTGMLLLDMVGGERLHGIDRSLVEPGTLLLLDPDGNLMIHHELDDQEEFLAYHVPEEKKPSRRSKKDERLPGGFDPAGMMDGSSMDMEAMYGFGGEEEGAGGGRRGRRGSRRSSRGEE